jgi:hypothetical protein
MGGTSFITKTELKKERGWTDSLIQEFAQVPDKQYPNPHSKKAGNVCLYSLDRIITIEESAEFKAKNEMVSMRKASAAKAVLTKIEQLKSACAGYKPNLHKLEYEELKERAITHHIEHKSEKRKYFGTIEYSLNRIMTNYARHMLSDYEYQLKSIRGKVGKEESYHIIRDIINQAIKEAYPFLSDEILL